MSKWIFRLAGLLAVALVSLWFLDKYLNPAMPDYLEHGLDVQTQGERKPAEQPAVAEPEVPQLSLTSLEGIETKAQPQPATPDVVATSPAPALEEAESIPVLSNPEAQRHNVWLQAGSFSERANAEKRAAVLKARRWATEIEPAVVEGKTFYRVYVGPLSEDQVAGYISKLDSMGIGVREVNR